MNLEGDDPRLSAWILGELSPEEAAEIEALVADSAALQAEAEDLRHLGDYLTAHLAPTPELHPMQREAVRYAVRAPLPPVVTFYQQPATRKQQRAWPTVLTAAAMIALGAFAFFAGKRQHQPRAGELVQQDALSAPVEEIPQGTTVSVPKPQPEANRAVAARTEQFELPPIPITWTTKMPDGNAVADTLKLPEVSSPAVMQDVAEIELPVVVGRSSYARVKGWIRERNQLPPKDAVRIEELANAFPLPPHEETVAFAGLRVACVSMASPWSTTQGRLVGVQIANESKESRKVAWSFRPGLGSKRLRVLASTDGTGGGASAVLPPSQRTLVLIEMASTDPDAGDLVVISEGRSRRFPAVESKDGGITQAGLVAAFGMWLRGEEIDDSRLSQILVSAGEDPDPVRADSRKLIREALGIAAAKKR